MRYPIDDTYDAFLDDSPVHLKRKLTPRAFSRNGDRLIMICNPSVPTIGNCRFYQSLTRLNPVQRKSIREKAQELGLAVIPALNIDLDKLSSYKKSIKITTELYEIDLTISPSGNIRLMDRASDHRTWVHTGKDSAKATLKVFEESFFTKWEASVIVTSEKGVMVKLKREGKHGDEIELEGAIKKSKDGNGFEVNVFPLHSDKVMRLGPLFIGGEFGFKIKITGQWNLWKDDGYSFSSQMLDFSSLYDGSDFMQRSQHIGHTHILSPEHAIESSGMIAMLPVLWRWYRTLPVWGEFIAAVPAALASG